MKIEHTEIYGFRAALRGMRNPHDSWSASDSWFYEQWDGCKSSSIYTDARFKQAIDAQMINVPKCRAPQGVHYVPEDPAIGQKDLELAQKLIKAGGDHRKFMRMIMVWCDFVLPRYVWQEVDTFKVATVRNSCSTMNMLGKRDLEQADFETPLPTQVLDALNRAVEDFREADSTKAKRKARVELKGILPEGYSQRATFLTNYEVGYRMFWSRRKHRLSQWREGSPGSICEWIKSWPYMLEFLQS